MGESQSHGASLYASRRNTGFAAHLQPLLIEQVNPQSAGCSFASALNAATPHVTVNHKLFTNRCKSSLLHRPATSQPALGPCSQSSAQTQQQQRCGTAPAPFRPQSPVTTDTLSLPGVLQFESWWTAGREQQRMSIYYHTATGQFHIRGPRDVWLTMHGSSGQQLDHWDLHVGAQLDFLGKPLVIKKTLLSIYANTTGVNYRQASCATAAWLDGWARLLLQQRQQLESQLLMFVPVVRCQSPVPSNHRGMQQGQCDQQTLPVEPAGGKVNLPNLREDVASLAWRLRQHKAIVQLPPELDDLKPQQGPAVWSISGASLSPQLQPMTGSRPPFTTPKPPANKHVPGSTRHGLAVLPPTSPQQQHGLPNLGETPTTLNRLTALNRVNPLAWLQGNPLAASAATDRRSYHATPKTARPPMIIAETPAGGGGPLWAKTPGPAASHRLGGHLTGNA